MNFLSRYRYNPYEPVQEVFTGGGGDTLLGYAEKE
jgi:hypothetical protein